MLCFKGDTMLLDLMLKLGYKKKDINKIINSYPLNKCSEENLVNNIGNKFIQLIDLGFNKEQVIKMTVVFPPLYNLSILSVKQKMDEMVILGYVIDEVKKMIVSFPSLIGRNSFNIKSKFNDLLLLGYSNEDIIKMTKILPELYSYDIESMKNKINELVMLGYTKEDIISMTKNFPALYSYSIDSIKLRIYEMINLGYTREEVKKMSIEFPSLFGFSIDTLSEKINFYDSIGLHSLFVSDPKKLMQSIKVSYARYEFYKSKGIILDINSFDRMFMSQRRFEKIHGISKCELLELYSYSEKVKIRRYGK